MSSFNKLIFIALRFIPKLNRALAKGFDDLEPSLLIIETSNGLVKVRNYVDNIFLGFIGFNSVYNLLANYLLPYLL
jgi:hypothetical protein